MFKVRGIVLIAVGIAPTVAGAQTAYTPPPPGQAAQDLKRLTIEELTEIDVTTVSRRVERLSETAAAISVIRHEDIRRSGIATLAEIMRLADAVDVARVNSGTWAVTARGFNISTANKLLVLIDGRTVYSPLFAGTFWDVQDHLLEDIDRVEVIRGPGGAIWGANAMNGVINIISREASATRGDLALVAAGTSEHAIVSARHGARMGRSGSYRVYGKYRQRAAGVFVTTGRREDNDLAMGQGGFRIESDSNQASRWFVQGDLYRGTTGLLNRDDGDLAGGNVLGRWSRRFSSSSELQAQAYYDRTWRKVPQQFEESRDTIEVDMHHRMLVGGRHDLIFGGAFRISRGDDRGAAGFFFEPEERTHELVSLFAQNEYAVRPNHLFVTVGSKFEGNDFTGLEVQPTIRLRWTPTDAQTFWAAVSRAVRLPTRFDTDLRIVNPATRIVLLAGTEDFKAETVVAYEAGYRVRPHPRLAIDLATYVNRYDDLRSLEFRPRQPITLENFLNATTSGVELAGTFQPAEHWRLHASYSYLYKDFSFDTASTDPTGGASEANDPSHLFSMRSYTDLPGGLEFDGIFRAVARRPNPEVPAYAELDLRLGWTVRAGWELSLVGQNLLHDRHAEQFTMGSPRFEFRRGAYVRSIWRF